MNKLYLWRYNQRSGMWDYVRTCEADTAGEWLSIHEGDEPQVYFKLAYNTPAGRPK